MSQIESWAERWREGRIGFHLDRVHPHLIRYGLRALWPAGARVLVPLCGKSLDMRLMRIEGYRVVGVEAVPAAAEAFFSEAVWTPEIREAQGFRVYSAEDLEIWNGDFFDFPEGESAPFDGIWDRAAMIALDSGYRARYGQKLMRLLKPGCAMLLVTVDYEQSVMDGPPYSVPEGELRTIFGPFASMELLGEQDVLDSNERFKQAGLETMREQVWLLRRSR